MTAFGLDTSAIDSEPIEGDLIGDQLALVQACVRRLITPRGALWYNADYGTDVRQFIGDTAPEGMIESAIVNELLKEEAVSAVTPRVRRVSGKLEITVQISASDASLSFTLSLSADGAIARILAQ